MRPHPLTLPLASLLGVMLSPQWALPQPGSWVQTPGPTGGNVNALIVSHAGSVLAGTEYGVFRSSDGGSSWKWSSATMTNRSVSNFALDSSGGIIVSTGQAALCRSTDDGLSWGALPGAGGGSIYGLCCKDTSTLWISTWGGGVRKTTDRGAHWQTLDSGLTMKYVMSLLVEDGGLAFAGTISCIFRTTNGGIVWDSASSGLPVSYVYSLARHPGGDLFAVTSLGTYRSTNNGVLWTKADGLYARCMVIDGAGLIALGMFSGDFRLSTDGGTIWNSTPISTYHTIVTMALSPSGVVYAGSAGQGVFRSTDKGLTWSLKQDGFVASIVNCLVRAPDNSMYAGTDGNGLHRTTDGGASWVPVPTIPLADRINSLALDDSGKILVGTWGQGILRQSGNDSTWQRMAYGYFYSIATSPGGVILAGVDVGKVLHSTDYGKTWAADSVTDQGVLSVVDGMDGFLYAGTSQKGVFRSSDLGGTWIQKISGLTNLSIRGFLARQSGILFACTDLGLFKTTDRGEVWTPVSTGLSSLRCLLSIGASRIIGAGWVGVSFSSDGGTSWGLVNDGLWSTEVRSLAIDANGYLYAGMFNSGVFKSVAVTAVDGDRESSSPAECRLWQNYPNPFNPSTTIRYDLSHRSHVTLAVFNMLGQQVAQLGDGEVEAGYHEVKFDGGRLSSGVYLYRMQAGSYVETKKLLLVR